MKYRRERKKERLLRYLGVKAIISWIRNWEDARNCAVEARKQAYDTYIRPPLAPQRSKRRRTHSRSRNGKHCRTKNQSQSRLLSLPAEVREIIWHYAMTGINIGLYRDKRRLTYSILDESNCAPGELFPITENTIKNKVIQYTSDPELLIHPPRTKKLQLSALPKTCRMVYAETIKLLYSGNNFVFLQNNGLADLQSVTIPHLFAQIRSVHIHWFFQELYIRSYRFPAPFNAKTFANTVKVFQDLKHLRSLSIFCQGELWSTNSFREIMDELEKIPLSSGGPEHFIVRFPWPFAHDYRESEIGSGPGTSEFGTIRQRLYKPGAPFKVVQQQLQPDQDPTCLADLEFLDDMGWRVGTMFFPSNSVEDGFTMTTYFVFTPVATMSPLRQFFCTRNFRSRDHKPIWF